MTFIEYLSKYICGNISEMDYPELALLGVLEGYGSKYFGYLAGMKRTDSIAELRKYLKWSLEELEIDIPTKREAGLLYSSGVVNEILNGTKEVIKGVSEIKNYALSVDYDFFSKGKKYGFESIGFHSIYSLFVLYYDIVGFDETTKEELTEIENEIFIELKVWKERLKILNNKNYK